MPTSARCICCEFAEKIGNRNILPRGDVGIAPYGGIIHLTINNSFLCYMLLRERR